MSESKNHKDRVSEPMGEKPVTDLPGIGETPGARLEDKGHKKTDRSGTNDKSESKKHKYFVGEPMSEKPVTDLPGIADKRGDRLEVEGYKKAYALLGKYLVLEKDNKRFMRWLTYKCEANKKQSQDCCKCLEEWCHQHF